MAKVQDLNKIFKAYDIRGLTPSELNAPLAHEIGQAYGKFLPAGRVAVGRDIRKDSAELASALMAGLVAQGREVIDLGLISSDMMYYAVGSMKLAGGAMVTASHNPGGYDGIKLTRKGVVPVGIDTGLLQIKSTVAKKDYKRECEGYCKTGKITQQDITQDWFAHCTKVAGPLARPLNVAIDYGNGMAAVTLEQLKKMKNLKLHSLYEQLDGTFPNHSPNPLEPKNTLALQKYVTTHHQDIGIAFDGDGDRAFFVDERGSRIDADIIAALLAANMLQDNSGATLLYSANSSRIVPTTIKHYDGKAIKTPVGHSYIKAEMKSKKAVFASEPSGHYYYAQNYNADSGLITALRVLHILSASSQTMSELTAPFANMFYSSGELNFEARDSTKVLQKLQSWYGDGQVDTLDGLSVYYPTWWFSLRASNTEPLLRLNVEADSELELHEQLRKLKASIAKAKKH